MGGGRGEGAKAEEGRRNNERIPNWCGSVGWLLSSKPKGHQFDSWSEHMPGLRVLSLVGECEKQLIDVSLSCQCFSPSLSSSIPLSLKINRIVKDKKTWFSVLII